MTSFNLKIDPRRQKFVRGVSDAHVAIERAISEEGLTRSAIAELLGVNKAVVTRALNGTSNITLKTITDLAWALDREFVIDLVRPSEFGNHNHTTVTSGGAISHFQTDAPPVSAGSQTRIKEAVG